MHRVLNAGLRVLEEDIIKAVASIDILQRSRGSLIERSNRLESDEGINRDYYPRPLGWQLFVSELLCDPKVHTGRSRAQGSTDDRSGTQQGQRSASMQVYVNTSTPENQFRFLHKPFHHDPSNKTPRQQTLE